MKASTVWLAIASIVACAGCTESTPDVTPEVHTDSSNDHEHHHGGEHDHGHGDGLAGTHSHDHSHNRSLGKPLHGGRIVPIGHAHHKGGVTHFHAEVMPLVDDVIRLYLLTESDDGESVGYSTEDKEIPALVSVQAKGSLSKEVSFESKAGSDDSAEFILAIPESLAGGRAFSVVIPKITLGGQRQNFSFSISRQKPVFDKPESKKSDE